MNQRKGTNRPKKLKHHQRCILWLAVLVVRLWSRTLRFRWGSDVQAFMDAPAVPSIVIMWHNRLFAVPEFFRRYFSERKLATIISASADGGWLAGVFEHFKILPVRGSRYGRGAQAFRELLAAHEGGYDIGVTPDGSRGPMYDMKPGAFAVAMKTAAPIIMLSFNYGPAWRLRSWDRFFLPLPFSCLNVKAVHIKDVTELGTVDSKEAAAILKKQLDAITVDELVDSQERRT